MGDTNHHLVNHRMGNDHLMVNSSPPMVNSSHLMVNRLEENHVENHLAMDSRLVMGNYIIDRELPNGELLHEGELELPPHMGNYHLAPTIIRH